MCPGINEDRNRRRFTAATKRRAKANPEGYVAQVWQDTWTLRLNAQRAYLNYAERVRLLTPGYL